MEVRKILVAVKPTSPQTQALRAAAQLAAAARAPLVVLAVTDSPWKLIGPEEEAYTGRMPSRGELIALAADRLSQRVAALLDIPLGADRVTHRVGIGLAAVEIARWSETEGADLIVLGREAHGLGGTIEGTVRRARVPCLIAAAGQDPLCGRILAAVAAGPDSVDVLEAAFAIGRSCGNKVLALHVERAVTISGVAPSRAESMRHSEALAGAVAAAWGHDTTVLASTPGEALEAAEACDLMVRQGDPVAEILRAVREERAELLVHGYHRGVHVNGHETSCIAARLLQRAPCAVLTVPI